MREGGGERGERGGGGEGEGERRERGGGGEAGERGRGGEGEREGRGRRGGGERGLDRIGIGAAVACDFGFAACLPPCQESRDVFHAPVLCEGERERSQRATACTIVRHSRLTAAMTGGGGGANEAPRTQGEARRVRTSSPRCRRPWLRCLRLRERSRLRPEPAGERLRDRPARRVRRLRIGYPRRMISMPVRHNARTCSAKAIPRCSARSRRSMFRAERKGGEGEPQRLLMLRQKRSVEGPGWQDKRADGGAVECKWARAWAKKWMRSLSRCPQRHRRKQKNNLQLPSWKKFGSRSCSKI